MLLSNRSAMKNIIKKTILALVVLFTAGCSDSFLDKPLQGSLTQQQFPVTATDAELAVNAMYGIMRDGNFHQGLYPINDIMSDDARKGSNPGDQSATIGPFDSFRHIPGENTLARWWNVLYEAVKRTNVVIEQVPEINMDASLRTRYIAEAHFLRALFYFDLVRGYGEVPIVLQLSPDIRTPQSTTEEVYAQIVKDLQFAVDNLPTRAQIPTDQNGRATKGSAEGILAKVYLFMGDYPNAEKYALNVINSGFYDLESSFEDANSVKGEYGIESVFETGALPYAEQGTDRGGDQTGNVQGVRGQPNRGWGFNRPSIDLQNSFEAGDPRLEATVIYLNETLDGVAIIGDSSTPDETKDDNGNVIETEVYNQKVWTPTDPTKTIDDVNTSHQHNVRILRYADVLLIAAEALARNAKPTDALVYLNRVRERARGGDAAILPDITETGTDALVDIILNERRHELALEGHRFWDLVRTGKAAQVLGPLGFVAGKHEYLPIPQTEIDLSQGSLVQHDTW
jgi:hypothetical protein